MLKQIPQWLMLTLGLFGIVVCIAVIVGIWTVSGRIYQATENVFGVVDETIADVQQRVGRTQLRAQELKITTQDIKARLEKWTEQEAQQRIASRLDIEPRSEQLAFDLQQADQWLELTESSLQIVRQAIEMGSSSNAEVQNPRIVALLAELSAVRSHLSQAMEAVQNIHDWAADPEMNKQEDRFHQVLSLAVRVLATFGTIDLGLEKLETRLAELQVETQSVESTALWWVQITAIGITLLALWMMAGQWSMCSLAWKQMRQVRASQA